MEELELIKSMDRWIFTILAFAMFLGTLAFTWYAVNQKKGGQGDE